MLIARAAVLVFVAASGLVAMQLTDVESRSVVTLGKEASKTLMDALRAALSSAIREGGPVHAVGFCSEKALSLTDEASATLEGLDLKRTSRRFRNIANAPDIREHRVLEIFESLPRSEHPERFTEKFERDGSVFYRYYEPVYVGGMCLVCHGERVSAEVTSILHERYPTDQALNYRAGDFRGLVRIEIPAERLAQSLDDPR